jgi:hypothetical protein
LKNGAVGIGQQFEMQRRKEFTDLALVFTGKQIQLMVAASIADQRSVGEQFGQNLGERGAVLFLDAIPG